MNMMNGDVLYELAQIREQEYMMAATIRRDGRRSRRQGGSLIAGAARRLRRRSPLSGS